MDAKPSEVASEPLKYQTWFLKVSIHCEGCRRKVKKVLQSIDGVFTTTIDPQQHKVTVTGSVGVETLLRKLVRAGKHAEIWPDNLDGKGKSSGKAKKKKNGEKDTERLEENHADENKGKTENAINCNTENKSINPKKAADNSPEKSPTGNQGPPESGQSEGGGGGGSGKKKKKKKGQSGGGNGSNGLSTTSTTSAPAHTGSQFQNPVGQQMGQMNLSPTRQQSYSYYPETGYPCPMVYVAATYNRLFPMGRMGSTPSYYVPPSPYMCAGLDQDTCQVQFQSTPLSSFEIFSDENANGCSIM